MAAVTEIATMQYLKHVNQLAKFWVFANFFFFLGGEANHEGYICGIVINHIFQTHSKPYIY